ncbi:unnamed protein product [Rhodiola kirilowii]
MEGHTLLTGSWHLFQSGILLYFAFQTNRFARSNVLSFVRLLLISNEFE